MPAETKNFPLKGAFTPPIENELEKFQSPAEFYQTLWSRGLIAEHRKIFYVSGPLNHFGAARLNHSGNGAFADNAQIKSLIADFIAEDQPDVQLVIPHHLGERHGWGEFHYNFLWMCYLSGMKPEAAIQIYDKARTTININHINDKSDMSPAAIEKRREEYNKMLDLFKKEWTPEVNQGALKPVDGLIALADSDMSLGGQLEKQAAKFLGIPIYSVIINTGIRGSTVDDRLSLTKIPQVIQLQRDGKTIAPLLRSGNLLPITDRQIALVKEDDPYRVITESEPVTLIEEFSEDTLPFIDHPRSFREKLMNAENAAILISGIVSRYLKGDGASNGHAPEKAMSISSDRRFLLFLDWIHHLQNIRYLPRSDSQLGLVTIAPRGRTLVYPPMRERYGNSSAWRDESNGTVANLDGKPSVVIFGSALESDPAALAIGEMIGKRDGICIVGGDGRNNSNAMSQVTAAAREHGATSAAITTEYLADHQPPDMGHHHSAVIGRNMATRKEIYYSSGDAFVALRGGIGTTEEIISTIILNLKAKMEGRKSKPMVVYNQNGHWDKLMPWVKSIGLRGEIAVLNNTSQLEKTIFLKPHHDLID